MGLTPAKVQDLGSATGTGSTVVLTLSGLSKSTTVGNVVSVHVRTGGGASLSTVADSKGNTWTVNKKGTTANVNSAIATTYLTSALANGDTITVTPSASGSTCIFEAAEFSGVAKSGAGIAVVDTSVNGHSTTTPITLATSAAAGKKDIVLSTAAANITGSTATVTAADPDSSGTWGQLSSTSAGLGGAYQIGPNSVSQFSVTWSFSGTGITNVDVTTVALGAGLEIITNASNVPGGSVGTAYSFAFLGQGGSGTKTWSITSGPAGLSFSGNTLQGTPTTAGTSNATVQVTDAGGNSASLAVTITIAGTGFQISNSSPLAGGTVGSAYGPVTLSTTGGTGSVTYSLKSGTMPKGLSITGTAATSLSGCTISNIAVSQSTLIADEAAWGSGIYPIYAKKVYYGTSKATGKPEFPAPATIGQAGSDIQSAKQNNIGVYLCYHPTYGGTSAASNGWDTALNHVDLATLQSERSALITSVNAIAALGVTVLGIVLWQEVDDFHKHGGVISQYGYLYSMYHGPVTASKANGGTGCPLGIIYVGYNIPYGSGDNSSYAHAQKDQSYFFGPTVLRPNDKLYIDFIGVDLYGVEATQPGPPITWHPERTAYGGNPTVWPHLADIADYAGIPFGWTESGNAVGPTNADTPARLAKYLIMDDTLSTNPGDATNSIQAVYNQRLNASPPLPCIHYMWYENPGGTGNNNIDPSSTTDPRINFLKSLASTINTVSGGQISGTPPSGSAGTYNFTIQAKDSTGAKTSKAFSLTVTGTTTTLAYSSSSPPNGTVNAAYQYTFTTSGGTTPVTYAITVGSLPAGLSLDPDGSAGVGAGVIYGTPTTAGSSTFSIKATDSTTPTAQTVTKSVTMTIAPAAVTGKPYLAGAASQAAGGSTTLQVSLQTNVNDGDSIVVGVLVDTSGVVPSVNDTQGNTYLGTLTDVTETGAELYVFECDGANGLSTVPPDPTDPNSQPDSVQVTYSANTSNQAAIVVGDNGVSGADKKVIAHGSSAAPSVASGALSQAGEHAIAFITDTSTGGVPTWAAGWSSNVLATVQASTGPRISAAYQTTNALTSLTASGTITSAPWTAAITTLEVALPSLNITLSGGVQGDPYSQTLTFSGGTGTGTWTVTSGSLPTGLSISGSVLSGTPSVAGVFPFTLQVTDANGLHTSQAVSITILSNIAANSPATVFPNDILTAAHANAGDFEVGTGLWASELNATGLAVSANTSVTGVQSLMWSSSAAGATAVHSPSFSVEPGQPYVVSGYVMPAGAYDNQIGINWYSDSSASVLISQTLGPDNPSEGIAWQPVQAALVAPSVANGATANAITARVVVLVQESNQGDVTHIDSIYVANSGAQVLIDWTNSPFASIGSSFAGADFMDVTPFVRLDQNISLTRGRQDMISEVQPGSAAFVLQNDTGMFTRFRAESLPEVLGGSVSLGCRCQVNLFDGGTAWNTRFDGLLNEIDYGFDPIGNTAVANISATDVLTFLNRAENLASWIKEQILADAPAYHWTLDDPPTRHGTGVCVESSGNNGPPLRLVNSDNTKTATVTFQDTSGGVETLANAVAPGQPDGSEFWPAGSIQPTSRVRGLDSGTVGPQSTPVSSVNFVPVTTSQTAKNYFVGNIGYQLQTELPTPISPAVVGGDYSFECWFTLDPFIGNNITANYGPYTIMSLGTSREGTCLVASINIGSSRTTLVVALYNQPPGFLGKNWSGSAPPTAISSFSMNLNTGSGLNGVDTVEIPHHLVVTLKGDPAQPVVAAYLDGVSSLDSSFSFTLPKSQYFDTFCLGGAFGGTGCHYGNISLASIYDYMMSYDQVSDHCMLGQYGMWEQPTDDCIARIVNYAGVPGYWNNISAQHNGLSLADYQDISNSLPLSAMQTFEQAERGLLFVNAAGQLSFHTRDWRMGYGAPDMVLPPGSYGAGLGYQVVDQFLVNEAALASNVYPAGAAFSNLESQAKYGPYANGTGQSPNTVPLITFNRAEGQLGLSTFGFNPDPNLSDAAAWEANAYSEPYLLPSSVTIDLLTLDPVQGQTIAQYYALEIDNMVAPNDPNVQAFPDEALSMEWFIEGIAEVYGSEVHTLQFYCSPAEPQRAWIPGDAAYGVLGSTARIGVSGPDVSVPPSLGKDVSHDAGEPFWPPTFSTGMNNPANNGHSFIGGLEVRGLVQTMSRVINPPMCVVSAISQTQSVPSGSNSTPQVFWDTVHVDTEGGMGLVSGWPNWYVCTVPGRYEIDASLTWSTGSGGGGGFMGQGWIVVARAAAQAVAAGTGTPLTVTQYVTPIGEAVAWNANSMNAVCNPTTSIYLGYGDMIALAAEQNSGSSVGTGTNLNGSHMSILFKGYATANDGVQFNTSIASGGAVTDIAGATTFTRTYASTHTYSFWGSSANPPYTRRITGAGGPIYQGTTSGRSSESQCAQIAMPSSTIHSDLNPGTGTVKIKSVTLTGTHIAAAGGQPGSYGAFGYSSQTPGGSTFNAQTVAQNDVKFEFFNTGETKTFILPNSFATEFQGNGTMIIMGDSQMTRIQNYGEWAGGPGAWLLAITYTVQ